MELSFNQPLLYIPVTSITLQSPWGPYVNPCLQLFIQSDTRLQSAFIYLHQTVHSHH